MYFVLILQGPFGLQFCIVSVLTARDDEVYDDRKAYNHNYSASSYPDKGTTRITEGFVEIDGELIEAIAVICSAAAGSNQV